MSDRELPTAEPAEIVREYGPLGATVHGVTYDGERVWCATGNALLGLSAESGLVERSLQVPCPAGTAFDGQHFYQIAGPSILKLDPTTAEILTTLPVPSDGDNAGLTWAEGYL